MDANFRPPIGNLGPMAEPWRRWAEGQAITNAKAIESLGGDATNDGRANNSQMDTFSSQINELYQRQSSLTTDPGFSSDLLAPSSSQAISRSIQIPRPTDGTRAGWLSITMNGSSSNTTDFSVLFLSFSCDGVLFHRNSISFPIGTSSPLSWRDKANVTAYTGFSASPTSGGLITIDAVAQTQSGGAPRAIIASDIRITSQYSQRI